MDAGRNAYIAIVAFSHQSGYIDVTSTFRNEQENALNSNRYGCLGIWIPADDNEDAERRISAAPVMAAHPP